MLRPSSQVNIEICILNGDVVGDEREICAVVLYEKEN